MLLTLATAENLLRDDRRLREIYNEQYELSFESDSGLQVAVNRKSSTRAVRIWVQNTFDPVKLSLSHEAHFTHYPPEKPRSHLSANRLTGPYRGRKGNDCWYFTLTSEKDFRDVISAYLPSRVSGPAPVPIPESVPSAPTPDIDGTPDLEDEESQFPEGAVKYRMHRHLERDGTLPKRAKAKRLQDTGSLCCDVCSFDFSAAYGIVGNGYIEAHHVKPVVQLNGTETTNIADLALVCANCHRMLHRGGSPMPIEELRRLFTHRAKET